MNKKYISNINKNNQKYTITIYIDNEKLNISLNYTNNFLNNSFQYSNYYSYRQLVIMNKFFKNYNNLEDIAIKLNQELQKTDNVTIKYFKDNIILSIAIKDEKESTNLYFKLSQNKETNNMNSEQNKYSDSREIKSMLCDLNEKINILENNMSFRSKYDGLPKKSSFNNVDNIYDNSLIIFTINNMITRMADLDKSKQLKDKKIQELEYIIQQQKSERNSHNYNMVKKPRGLIEDFQNSNDSKIIKKSKNSKNSGKLKSKKAKSVVKNNKKYKNSDASLDNDINKKNRNQSSLGFSRKTNEEEKNNEIENKEKESNYNSLNYNEEDNKAQTNLAMVDREDLRNYVNSRIFFTKKELIMVKRKILKGQKKMVVLFDIIYRATIDGDYEYVINHNCEGVYPQLILFYTHQGARFGIYIEKEKHTNILGNVSYKEVPGSSFILSLNSLQTFDILPEKKATEDSDEKLSFGRSFLFNKNGSNWLIFTPRNEFLNARCIFGDQEGVFGKIDVDKIIGTNKTYQLKEVEIFKVSIEPLEDFSTDEEKNKNEKKVNNKKVK